MKFPWKKKEEILEETEREEITDELAMKPVDIPRSDNRVDLLEVEIERLKATLSTSKEFQKAMEERFSHVSESIGELRTSVIEREKQIKDLEIAALRSSDLVKEVQPEKLMLETRKAETKIDVLQGKLDSYDNLFSSIIEEIKAIRRLTAEFEGVESIRDLNREMRGELGEIKKAESRTAIESSKIAKIFEEMQKKYEEQQEIKSILHETITENTAIKKEMDAINVRFSSLLDKDEMVKLKGEIRELLSEAGMRQYKQKGLLEKTREIIERGKESIIKKKEAQQMRQSFQPPSSSGPEESKKQQSEFIASIEKELGKTKAHVKELERHLSAIYHDPSNPVYLKLKEDIFKKLVYYDAFLSDTLTKIPLMEQEILSLREQLKLILNKNHELITLVSARESREINEEAFAKEKAVDSMKEKFGYIESKFNENQESVQAQLTELNKKLHKLS